MSLRSSFMGELASSEQRVVVSGSSGLIGTALVTSLKADGIAVTRLVRRTPGVGEARWSPDDATIDASAFEGATAVVHLAGTSIGAKKWSDAQKRDILDSRTKGTALIARTLAGMDRPPNVFVSASAVGFYGDRGDDELDEASTLGKGFLAEVVREWEAAAASSLDQSSVRVVYPRTGIVLSTRGGALGQQLLPFKLGLGGRLGSGKQWLPWITITDTVRAIRHLLATETLRGPVNVCGPNPVTNAVFTKALGQALGRPTLIPIPLPALRLLYGSELVQELLLSSSRAKPTKLVQSGFSFNEPDLASALRVLLSTKA